MYRYYQQNALDSTFNYFRRKKGNPIIAMPTGTGKSWVNAGIIEEVTNYPGQRILCLTHVKELIAQNYEKAIHVVPDLDVGIVSAGLGFKEYGYDVTFAGIGSIYRQPEKLGKIDIVIIDECHLVSNNIESMYGKVIVHLRGLNPLMKIIGLSATAYRLKDGMLTDGKIFTDVCFDLTGMKEYCKLQDEGFIAPLVAKKTAEEFDVSGVPLRGGEFVPGKLHEAVDKKDVTIRAVDEMVKKCCDRKHWLVFGAGIEHSKHVTLALQAAGVSAEVIHSKISDSARDNLIAAHKQGEFLALVNNGILTTGYDFPAIDCIGDFQPTCSPGKHVQKNGRGSRPSVDTGKVDCLVQDFAGNTKRLGPINNVVLPDWRGRGLKRRIGNAPVKACPNCDTFVAASAVSCEQCGYTFPRRIAITTTASEDELVARDEIKTMEFDVSSVQYSEHSKRGGYPSLKVTYFCGLRRFQEWVCLCHPDRSYPLKKARNWWLERSTEEYPTSIKGALESAPNLKKPKKVMVWVNKKYPELLGFSF